MVPSGDLSFFFSQVLAIDLTGKKVEEVRNHNQLCVLQLQYLLNRILSQALIRPMSRKDVFFTGSVEGMFLPDPSDKLR